MLVEVVLEAVSLLPFLLFLCFLLPFMEPLSLLLIVLLDEVFCAKTAVPERRDKPKVAIMIFFM